MSILRKQTRRGYTHIANELLEAEGLSFRARGIAAFLLSKPDDWEIKTEYLMKMGREGERAIRTALHELAAFGFLMRDRIADEQGKLRTVTYVADYPAYINVGSVERRILGYEPQQTDKTDLAISDRSVSRRSKNRPVGKGELLVNTDKGTTANRSTRRRKNYSEPPTDQPRRKYSQ